MYRPLPQYVTIMNSSIDGLGMFSTEFIPSGTDIGMTHVYDERFPDNYIRLPLGGFFNHSEEPNCEIEKSSTPMEHLRLRSIKDIQAGEEITAFYTLYNPTNK